MSLFVSIERKTTGRQARVKCSHTCFVIADERQAVVLVRHPDHTVGQAQGTSIKPISGRRLPDQSITLFHGPWCAAAHELLVANPEEMSYADNDIVCYD
jgi:hypothetical protein